MILIDKPRLKFLLAGREITLAIDPGQREYHKGRHYSVGIHHNRTICRAQVMRLRAGAEGVELTLKLAETEPPRLLGRTGGYVTDPAMALPDEPEAVDASTQDRLSELGTLRWQHFNAQRENEKLARSLSIRLRDAQRRGDADELARIRAEIERLEDRIRAA